MTTNKINEIAVMMTMLLRMLFKIMVRSVMTMIKNSFPLPEKSANPSSITSDNHLRENVIANSNIIVTD
jgi:hypothetical protein